MNWYLQVLKQYARISGRAQRAEYWYFVLFNSLVMIGLAIVDALIGSFMAEAGMGILSAIYVLAILIPSFAVLIRRLHDTDRSGWWLLITFIPVIGAIAILVFTVQDGTPGDNSYGPNPKSAAN